MSMVFAVGSVQLLSAHIHFFSASMRADGAAGLPMQLMTDEYADSDEDDERDNGLPDEDDSDLPSSSAADSDDSDESREILCLHSCCVQIIQSSGLWQPVLCQGFQ